MFSNFALLGLSGAAAFVVILVLLLIFAFELAMFISVILNKNITGNTKALWFIGMLLLHPFVAIWYYFTDYKKAA